MTTGSSSPTSSTTPCRTTAPTPNGATPSRSGPTSPSRATSTGPPIPRSSATSTRTSSSPSRSPTISSRPTISESDYIASLFTRFQPDTFYPVQERLPELRFDLLPTPVGGGIYLRFNSGLVHLEEDPPAGGIFLESDRFDTFARAQPALLLQGHCRLHARRRRPVHRVLGHRGGRRARRHRTRARRARI